MKKISAAIITLAFIIFAQGCRKGYTEECETPVFGTPYEITIPPFFPPMDIPVDNPTTVEGIELGRLLFWEPLLSGDNSMSCGSCHFPEHSFSDPAQFSVGITGAVGTRQSMALLNLGWAKDYFWDGRALTLEEQLREPIPNPIEMNQSWEDALNKLRNTDLYPAKFAAAFGDDAITEDRAVKAMAQFLRTMVSANSKFDKWRRGEYIFTEAEFRGYELFQKEGGDPDIVQGGQFGADCFHCHGEAGLQFTDYLPHNNGLDSEFSDLGVGGITGNPLDYGRFKTPTLRNVELSAPYMHDGRFNTLEEVVEHYNSGGLPSPTVDPFMKYTEGGLMLPPVSKLDIIAFLKTLTDTSFVNNPDFQNPHE